MDPQTLVTVGCDCEMPYAQIPLILIVLQSLQSAAVVRVCVTDLLDSYSYDRKKYRHKVSVSISIDTFYASIDNDDTFYVSIDIDYRRYF